MQELVTLLGSVSVLALLATLVTCALGLRRRAIRRGLSWAEALSQWWAWLRTELSAWSPAAGSGSGAPTPRHSRTSRVWRAFLVLVWVAAVFLVSYQAQPVSAADIVGYQQFYILGDEEHILAALIAVNPPGSPDPTQGPIHSRLSIVADADSVNIYLDEWENGYSGDPFDPSTADAQWLALNKGDVLTLSETDAFVPGSEGVDGGDRLFITGAASVVRIVWPDTPGPYLAGSWELYPLPAWKSSYVVPVGEDLDFSPDSTLPFQYTFLFIEAAEDNTQVVVRDPTGGVLIDTVLSRGENIYLPDINAGTTVTASSPIQAGLITSVNDVYDSRYYTLTPEDFLCNEYYLPVPSMQFPADEFGGRDVDTAAYIYAFQDNTVVNIETSTGIQTTPPLSAGEVYRYVMPRAEPAGTPQGPYGARITTDRPGDKIWILVAGDDDAPDLDWGYQAMCASERRDTPVLGDEYYLPFAPANPAHITPIDDDTTFFVDWYNDGVVDETFTLDRFETRMLFPPSTVNPKTGFPYDATGAHIRADGRFAIAWGQDNTELTLGEWGLFADTDIDFGYTVLPLKPGLVDIVLTFEKTVDPTSLPAEGGAVQFTLVASTEAYPVYDVDISDTLPPGWRYVPGTTTISFSDGTPDIYDDPAGAPGPDLLWALDKDLGPRQSITVTFGAETIPGAYSAGWHENRGQACGEDENGNTFCPDDFADVYIPELPALSLAKTSSAGGLFNPGDTITYTIVISNVGTAPATGATVSDTLPANTTWADNVTIAPPSAGGTAGTPPIIASGMTVDAGSRVTVTFTVTVNTPLPAGVDTITNMACVSSAEISTPICDTVTDTVEGPAIELAKTVYLGHDGGAGCPGSESVTGANGADVTYCFEVTNTGNTYLDDITIDDADLGIDETQMTLLRGSMPLALGDNLVYYYEGTIRGDLVNTAKTEGNPTDADGNDLPGMDNPTDDDPAEVYEWGPAIELAKTVYLGHDGGAGCPGSESVTGANGADVTYCFEVTNTGNTYLDDITIDDADLGIDETQMTLLRGSTSTSLAPGDNLVYYYEGTIRRKLVNTARTEGTPTNAEGTPIPGLEKPTDDDTAEVRPTSLPEDDDEPPPTDTPTPTPTPRTEVTPTPTPVTVVRLPETGGFPGWVTVVLGVPLIIGAAGLLNLALLEKRGRRGDRKGD